MTTATVVPAEAAPAAAGPAGAAAAAASALTVDVSHYKAETNPTQWGHIIEDISHSVEGGLNANLVRNSTMKENGSNPPAYWSTVTSGGGTGTIALDTTGRLNAANPNSLKLTVGSDGIGQRVGVANSGFYGVGLKPSTSYTATFFAKASNYAGPLTVSLESVGGTSYGQARTSAVTSGWARYSVVVTTSAATPVGSGNRVVISVPSGASGASVWLNVVQVLPPTYGTSGLLRTDLMQKLAGTEPGFWRVPGGNYLEGATLATRFDWKKTIGAVQNRPGHLNDAWGYFSTDQAGLKAYLDMAEQSGAQPLLAVFAGYTLHGTVVGQADLNTYVQDALDEIQYVTGDRSTPWGAKRAADGHPAPYALNYVEIGNEDFFDGSGSYDAYRFPAFYDAIKAAYPKLQIVATTSVTSRRPDVIDEHYYNNDPAAFTAMAHKYDTYNRSRPKVLVGEYAITNGTSGNPTGTLSGAIGEAGFMTGMLNNSDVVMGASYAPALANVNNFQWPTNLIGFDASTSFGSPSYYVQQIFGTHKGRYVVPTSFTGVDPALSYVASRADSGEVYVQVVNPTDAAVTTRVNIAGATAIGTAGEQTTLTGDPVARNSITAPNAITPTTKGFTAGPRFNRTFPAHSVSSFTVSVSGALSPKLAVDRLSSLRATTPGYTDRSVAVDNGVGVTKPVTTASSDADRKSATFITRTGLGDASCYSFESRLNPGRYLRVAANLSVVAAAPDSTSAFAADATFCASTGHSGSGVSFESKSHPGRFVRHYNNNLYAAESGGPNPFDSAQNFAADTTFTLEGGFWLSAVDLPAGRISLQSAAPATAGQYLRQQNYLGVLAPLSASSPDADRQDATFVVEPGRSDRSCYSFESVNHPGRFLRHYGFRIHLDPPGGGPYDDDATFCAQPAHNGSGVSLQSIGFPDHYLRSINGEVWIASNGGTSPSDTSTNWVDDTSWTVAAPLAPAA